MFKYLMEFYMVLRLRLGLGFVVIMCMLVWGCKSGSSSPEWLVSNKYEDSLLLQIPPEGTLFICNDNDSVASTIQQAITDWAKVVGRDQFINIQKLNMSNCQSSISNDTTFFLGVGEKLNKSASLHSKTGTVWAVGSTIGYKFDDSTGLLSYNEVLKAVGMLWGLCSNKFSRYECKKRFKGKTLEDYNVTSIMGEAYRNEGKLTDEDQAALISVASFEDIGANKQWKNFLAQKYQKQISPILSMFNPTCINKGQLSIVDEYSPVYVSSECSKPENPKYKYEKGKTVSKNCQPKDFLLVGGTAFNILETETEYIAESCSKSGNKTWHMPISNK